MVYFPPRYRQPVVQRNFTYNSVINIGGGYGGSFFRGGSCFGGHVHHCDGGMSKGMGIAWGIGLVTSMLGALFNKGGTSQVMPMQTMPMQTMPYGGYNAGYNTGLYTPGGYNAGYNMGLYGSGQFGTSGLLGQYSSMQGQYGQQQTVLAAKGNELVAMIRDLGNDCGFTFGENEEVPQLTPDGQNYTYKGQTFATVTDLRNFIEQQEKLVQARPNPTDAAPGAAEGGGTEGAAGAGSAAGARTGAVAGAGVPDDEDDVDDPPATGEPAASPTASGAGAGNPATSPTATGNPAATTPGGGSTPAAPSAADENAMKAKLRGAFGNVPDGVTLNADGTYNYEAHVVDAAGKVHSVVYKNVNVNALRYLINAEKNYVDENSQALESPEHYDNFTNNDSERKYENGKLSLTKQQISNTETFAAFMLRNHVLTEVELGKTSKADFEKAFANMFDDSVKNSKTSITQQEFLKYFNDYERNAATGDLRRDKERQKTETVDMTGADLAHLKNLFYAMSDGTGTVTKEQYTSFMTELFNTNGGKITRIDLDDFAAKWITSHTTDENITPKADYRNERINMAMDTIRNAMRVYQENGDTGYKATALRDRIIEGQYSMMTAEEKQLLENAFKEEFGEDIKKCKNNWFTKTFVI